MQQKKNAFGAVSLFSFILFLIPTWMAFSGGAAQNFPNKTSFFGNYPSENLKDPRVDKKPWQGGARCMLWFYCQHTQSLRYARYARETKRSWYLFEMLTFEINTLCRCPVGITPDFRLTVVSPGTRFRRIPSVCLSVSWNFISHVFAVKARRKYRITVERCLRISCERMRLR